MIVNKLLTEQHLEFLSLKGDCKGLYESALVKKATLLEISCRGSIMFFIQGKRKLGNLLMDGIGQE